LKIQVSISKGHAFPTVSNTFSMSPKTNHHKVGKPDGQLNSNVCDTPINTCTHLVIKISFCKLL